MNIIKTIWSKRAAWLPGVILVVVLFAALVIFSPGVRTFALKYTF